MSGLNVRTIQRIESGNNASLESLKAIAAVLEVDVSTLKQENSTMNKDIQGWENLPVVSFEVTESLDRGSRSGRDRCTAFMVLSGPDQAWPPFLEADNDQPRLLATD